MFGVMTSLYSYSQYFSRMKSMSVLYMQAPAGCQKHEPGDTPLKKKSSCLTPSTRWSRFLASAMRC